MDSLQSGSHGLRTTSYVPLSHKAIAPASSGNESRTVLPKLHDNSRNYQNKDNVSVALGSSNTLYSRIPG